MDNLEAVQILEDWNKDLSLMEDEEDGIECHNMAIMALKKRIPQKPQYTQDIQFALCECGNGLQNGWKFCPDCGQSIDWSKD